MSRIILLDANVLGLVTNPGGKPEAGGFNAALTGDLAGSVMPGKRRRG